LGGYLGKVPSGRPTLPFQMAFTTEAAQRLDRPESAALRQLPLAARKRGTSQVTGAYGRFWVTGIGREPHWQGQPKPGGRFPSGRPGGSATPTRELCALPVHDGAMGQLAPSRPAARNGSLSVPKRRCAASAAMLAAASPHTLGVYEFECLGTNKT
jgi:hypothetical protein